ncbi:helix-turn-helix domain-containing protein [Micrococcus luteus]|uniref:helix-turn-helix domain-containing protein n=1 Tax=Micrococcus luteus TaxID=1270 RepID=UPI0038146693
MSTPVHTTSPGRGPVRRRPALPGPPAPEATAAAIEFGATVKRLRTSRRVTQVLAAEAAGVSDRWWRRMEAGQRVPSLGTLTAIVAVVDPLAGRDPWPALSLAYWLELAGCHDHAPHVREHALSAPMLDAVGADRFHLAGPAAEHARTLLRWAASAA